MALFAKKLGFTERATAPATPAAGNREVYYKTDGLLYSKDSAGVETIIGGNIAWTDFSASAVLTWDITPGGVGIDAWKYRVINGLCFFTFYISAEDGNNATLLSSSLPIVPTDHIYMVNNQIIGGIKSVHGSSVIMGPNLLYIGMQTATDGQSLVLSASGFYPV